MLVRRWPIRPPVHDSARANVQPRARKARARRSSIGSSIGGLLRLVYTPRPKPGFQRKPGLASVTQYPPHGLLTRLPPASILPFVSQLSFFGLQSRVWTVADLTRYVRQLLEGDYRLQDVWVAGEVSNLSRPASGHLYFTLKDGEASLRGVMWRTGLGRE